jgi:hypothetical protein
MFDYMTPSVNKTVNALADWTERHDKLKPQETADIKISRESLAVADEK